MFSLPFGIADAPLDYQHSVTMRPQQITQPRDAWLDQLKAIAIFGVVLIHVGIPLSALWRFCVPLFVTAWAYSFENGFARRTAKEQAFYVWQRLYMLFVPYLFWSFLYCALFTNYHDWQTTSWHTILGGWFGGYGWPGQYFFIILFQLTMMFSWLRQYISPCSQWYFVGIGCVINGLSAYGLSNIHLISALGDRLFIYWIPYCVLGIVLARKYVSPDPRLLLAALAFLSLAPFELNNLTNTSSYVAPSIVFGSLALCLAVGPGWRPTRISSSPRICAISNMIATIGRHSMPIFLTNALTISCCDICNLDVGPSPLLIILKQLIVATTAIGVGIVVGLGCRRLRLGILVGAN
jgi:fucose 4-O-acetylase-like acetyltransferase